MSIAPSRRDRKRKPKAKLSFGSSNGSSGNLPSNMQANLPELFQLLKNQNEELEVHGASQPLTNGSVPHSGDMTPTTLTNGGTNFKKRVSEEDIAELVERTMALLKHEGPMEEKEILRGIGPRQALVAEKLPTPLGAHLLQEHRGFHCCTEGSFQYYYYDSDDDTVDVTDDRSGNVATGSSAIPRITGTTTTTTTTNTTTTRFGSTNGTSPGEQQTPPAGSRSWCAALENSSCSNSAYESAEDEEAWALSRSTTPLSVASGMSPPPVVRAPPVMRHNQETQTEPPPLYRTAAVMTLTTSTASAIAQTDQSNEVPLLEAALKKRNDEISDLHERLCRLEEEHREETHLLHSKIAKLQFQLQIAAGDMVQPPPAAKQAPAKEEIHSLILEPKRELSPPAATMESKALEKTEEYRVPDFYEVQMKMEQQAGGGGSCSDLESMWSSGGGSPKRGKTAQEMEDKIIRRLKHEKPNFTEARIREYLNKFREMQNGLSGMTVKAIVAGIMGLMKSSPLNRQ